MSVMIISESLYRKKLHISENYDNKSKPSLKVILYFFCVIGQPRLIAPLSCLFTPLIVKNYIVILKKHFVLILQHLNVSIYIRTFNMMHGLTTYKNTIQW